MPATREMQRSPLALTVLSLLFEGPLHPYAIQARIKAWGKDVVVNVRQRASLYKAIERLRDAGLIAIEKTERDQRFPERTVYRLTLEGRRRALEWLYEMLSTPREEFPEFPAALSFIFGLTPARAVEALEERAAALREKVEGLDRPLQSGFPPRLFLLEIEFLKAAAASELEWVSGVLDDLKAGRLDWSEEWLAAEYADLAKRSLPAE